MRSALAGSVLGESGAEGMHLLLQVLPQHQHLLELALPQLCLQASASQGLLLTCFYLSPPIFHEVMGCEHGLWRLKPHYSVGLNDVAIVIINTCESCFDIDAQVTYKTGLISFNYLQSNGMDYQSLLSCFCPAPQGRRKFLVFFSTPWYRISQELPGTSGLPHVLPSSATTALTCRCSV